MANMKKTALWLSIVAAALTGLAVLLLILTPQIMGDNCYFDAYPALDTFRAGSFSSDVWATWRTAHQAMFTFSNFASYPLLLVSFIILIVLVALWIVHLIFLIKNRRPNATAPDVLFVIFGLISLDFLAIALCPGYFSHPGYYSVYTNGVWNGVSYDLTKGYKNVFEAINTCAADNSWAKFMGLMPYILAFAALAMFFVALPLSLADVIKYPGLKAKPAATPEAEKAAEQGTAAEKADENEEARKILNGELADEVSADKNAQPQNAISPEGYSGPAPQIIQYITYGSASVEPKKEEPSKVQEEEDTPVTAEELRKLIKEALDAHEHPEEQQVNHKEARDLVREEIDAYYAKDEKKEEPAEEAGDMLTSDELRQIIREEIGGVKKDEGDTVLTIEDLREVVREEVVRAQGPKTEPGLNAEQVRTIVAQELDKRLIEEKPAPKKEVAPAPKAEPAPVTPTVAVKVEQAAPAPAPVVVAPAPKAQEPEAKAKIVRVPFPDRIVAGDKELKDNFNEIKAEALSFGLKSRLSNSGDTFRLHTKAYLKITVAGKGLKIYYALSPKAYANSPIPVKDASGKNLYKDIPLVFKVKSPLSVKRAKQLIADACAKDNLTQGEIPSENYVTECKNYQPQTGKDDEED
jgi:hypothetical protein